VLLLAGATLFARSLYNLKTLNPGFVADQLLSFSIDPSLNGYSRERSIALRVRRGIPFLEGARDAVHVGLRLRHGHARLQTRHGTQVMWPPGGRNRLLRPPHRDPHVDGCGSTLDDPTSGKVGRVR
jgi:hypothetical protein